MDARIWFAESRPVDLNPDHSIGAKWIRLLARLDLPALVRHRTVCVKMHLGGGTGFTTIHPFFVRKLIGALQASGARQVWVTDSPDAVVNAIDRGYTEEVLGCPLRATTGEDDALFRRVPVTPAFRSLDYLELAENVVSADVLVDLSHIKGHGCCGFGGAIKNLAMGAVTRASRQALHALEGGLEWNAELCRYCNLCVQHCPHQAIRFRRRRLDVNFHDCKLCQHCRLICPAGAIQFRGGAYREFQQGLAVAAAQVLNHFPEDRRLFINFLMSISMYCDCWGMTTPVVVPDIGILAGNTITAIEQASLDLIRTPNLIRGVLPPGWKLGRKGHLFERLHGKDPFPAVHAMEDLGFGSRNYQLRPVD
jgi:uncharacterized Fe-S center protein